MFSLELVKAFDFERTPHFHPELHFMHVKYDVYISKNVYYIIESVGNGTFATIYGSSYICSVRGIL